MVLFPWLVAVYLQESAVRVGIAQMTAQLPMLLLILVGGWLGDRVDQRKLLIGLNAAMAFPPLVVCLLFQLDYFSYSLLIVWALVGGTFAAFVQPARDALLNRVAQGEVQRVVTLSVGVQFGVQIIGFGLGSTADILGPESLLLTMAVFMLAASISVSRIPPFEAGQAATSDPPWVAIRAGLQQAWHHDAIRPAIFQSFSVGIFFAGAYMVLLPLMVRDLYGGGSLAMAGTFAANMAGTVLVTALLIRRGPVLRPGRTLLVGAGVSALVLSLLYLDLSQPAFYAVVFLWGCCGGIGMTMSRTIVQEAAPEAFRARVMSVYALGLMGGMPIGSYSIGVAIEYWGAQQAVWLPVIGMLVVLLYLGLRSKLWWVESALPTQTQSS